MKVRYVDCALHYVVAFDGAFNNVNVESIDDSLIEKSGPPMLVSYIDEMLKTE